MTALALLGLGTVAPAQIDFETERFANNPFSPSFDIITDIKSTPIEGDTRLFVTWKSRGWVMILNDDGTYEDDPVLSVNNLIGTVSEGGLLGLAFHPDFDGVTNRYFYLNYTSRVGTSASVDSTVIARVEMSEDEPNEADASTLVTLLEIPQDQSNHNGGHLQFGPDGMLYVMMGDGGGANDVGSDFGNCRAQNPDLLLGKILRLDVNQNVDSEPYHGIPADNPYVDDDAIPDEVVASGLRNPWRFSFDSDNGDVWIADVGQGQREEVNRVPFDSLFERNFGWPVMEGFNCFSSIPTCPFSTAPCFDSSLTLPIHEYAHGSNNSITGGYVYRGGRNPSIEGKYIYGDYASGRIWALDPNTLENTEVADLSNNSLTTFGLDTSGQLYFSLLSQVYRVIPAEEDPVFEDRWVVR